MVLPSGARPTLAAVALGVALYFLALAPAAPVTAWIAASFDAGYMLHVGMNIGDKRALAAATFGALRPGGAFGLFDMMRGDVGALAFPLPFATTAADAAVATPDEYRAAYADAGFELVKEELMGPACASMMEGAIARAKAHAQLLYFWMQSYRLWTAPARTCAICLRPRRSPPTRRSAHCGRRPQNGSGRTCAAPSARPSLGILGLGERRTWSRPSLG